jgi:hypothetical protein
MPEQSDPYVLGGTQTEQQRLVAQASEFEMQARWLLDQIDIRPGGKTNGTGFSNEASAEICAAVHRPQR